MYAIYIVYNNEKTIGASLNSIVPYIEKVVMVDGVFTGFPHTYTFSTDRTKEIAQKICDTKLTWIPHHGEVYTNPSPKRNVGIKHVPDGTWYIIIDADEVINGEIERELRYVEENCRRCAWVTFVNYNPKWKGSGFNIPREQWDMLEWVSNVAECPRLYRYREGHRYRNDFALYDRHGTYLGEKEYTLKDVQIVNMKYLRSYDDYIGGLMWRYAYKGLEIPK